MKKSIAKVLLDEGYIKNVEFINEGVQGSIKVTLKYVDKKPVIVGIIGAVVIAVIGIITGKSLSKKKEKR